jgi:hypothetical protein
MEEIRIDEINIREPLVTIHLGDVDFLEKAILSFGILSPPILFKNDDSLEVVDGWARLKIANRHSTEKVKCHIIKCSLRDAFLFHLSLNIKWRGFSEGERLLIFKKFLKLGFGEEEAVNLWEKISGERISKDFFIECLKLYEEIPEITEFLHSGRINLTTAKELLKFPEDWRKEILSFLIRVKASAGECINFLRLLEDGLYSGRIEKIDYIQNHSDLKSPLKKTFELSHPYTAKCMEEIEKILKDLPPQFCLKLPEYLSGNNAELKIHFNILEDLKIPENLNEILSKVRKVVVEGVDL